MMDHGKANPIEFDDASLSQLEFVVELGSPVFNDVLGGAYGKPVNIRDQAKNTGFAVHELLSNDPGKYRSGQLLEKIEELALGRAAQNQREGFANGYDKFPNPGILITKLDIDEMFGKLQYKCPAANQFQDVVIDNGKVLALQNLCHIKFEPASQEKNWKENDVKFHIRLVSDITDIEDGVHENLDTSDNRFSRDNLPVVLLGLGCNGVIGGDIKDEGCGACSIEKKGTFQVGQLFYVSCVYKVAYSMKYSFLKSFLFPRI